MHRSDPPRNVFTCRSLCDRLRRPVTLLAAGLMVAQGVAAPIDVIWDGSAGDMNWMTAGNWMPQMVPDNDAMNTYRVTLPGALVVAGPDIEIDALTLGTGGAAAVINPGGDFTVKGVTTVDLGGFLGGTFKPEGVVNISRGLILDGATHEALTAINVGVGAAAAQIEMDSGAVLNNDSTITFLNDGGVSGNDGQINNNGLITKTGGTGQSSITADIVDQDGTIRCETGTLALHVALLNGTTLEATGGALQLGTSGTLTQIDGTVTINSMAAPTPIVGNALIVNGTLETQGDRGVRITGNAVVTGGGLLSAEPNAPVVVTSGIFGSPGDPNQPLAAAVRNNGRLRLKNVDIVGSGLTNETGGLVRFRSGLSREVAGGTFTNSGDVEQYATVTVRSGGRIVNNGDWLLTSAGINFDLGGQFSGLFTNTGTLRMDGGTSPGFAVINGPFRGTSGSTIAIDYGEIRLGASDPNASLLSGTIDVDGARSASNRFSIGTSGQSRSANSNINFVLSNGGKARWLAGQHTIQGLLQSIGNGEVEVQSATLRADQSASLDFDENAPLIVNHTNATVETDAEVTNLDRLVWKIGAVTGLGQLVNAQDGVMDVQTQLRISRGGAGQVRNRGALNLTGGNFNGITLDAGGTLRNDPDAVLGIVGDSDIARQGGTPGGDVINQGTIDKNAGNGESLFTPALFRQEADGITRASSGTIKLAADLNEIQGELEALAGATIRVFDESVSEDTIYRFAGNGVVDYSGPTSATQHDMVGTLMGLGQGTLQHTTGTMAPRDAVATLQFIADPNQPGSDEAVFLQSGGVLGQGGSTIANRGNLRMQGGEMLGVLSNTTEGRVELDGGTLRAATSNDGDFIWSNGTIDAFVSNISSGSQRMELAGADPLNLTAAGRITNMGLIQHTSEDQLRMADGVQLINESGAEYVFSDGGDIQPLNSGDRPLVINRGTIRNDGPISTIIRSDFQHTGGTLEAVSGSLAIEGIIGQQNGEPVINGGFLRSFAPTLSTSFARLESGVTHDHVNGGRIEHLRPAINGTLTGTGRGVTQLNGSTADGGAGYNLVAGSEAVFELTGAHEVAAAATASGGTVRFFGPTFTMHKDGSDGSFSATATLEFENNGNDLVTLVGPESGLLQSRVEFTSNETATQKGSSDVRLDGAVQFNNVGTYDLTIDGGISNGPIVADDDLLFDNTGTFCKSNGLPGSFSTVSVPFQSSGTVRVKDGNLRITNCLTLDSGQLTGGTWIIDPNTSLDLNNSAPITGNDGNIQINGGVFKNFTGAADFENDGQFTVSGGTALSFSGEFENNGTATVGAGSVLTVDTIDNDGTMVVNGDLVFAATASHQTGNTKGTGSLNGGSITNRGAVCPGNSPGTLTCNAALTNDPNGLIQIELGGTTPGSQHDLLVVNGPLTLLGGTLDVLHVNGFTAGPADSFTVITAASISGTFDNTPADPNGTARVLTDDGSFAVQYTPTSVILSDFQPTAACPGDTNGDNVVDLSDLAQVISEFGQVGAGFAGDVDGDGDVDLSDLALVLGVFGSACP